MPRPPGMRFGLRTSEPEVKENVEVCEDSGRILSSIGKLLQAQQRVELALSKLVSGQVAIATAVQGEAQKLPTVRSRRRFSTSAESLKSGSASIDAFLGTPLEHEARWTPGDTTTGLLELANVGLSGKLAIAEATVGNENILKPWQAKAWLEEHDSALFLDVQDSGAPTLPEVYSISMGQLLLAASNDLPEYRDPMIADRDRSAPLLVTCATGNLALLAAKVLVDYGFTDVKTVEGGNNAWRTYFAAHPCRLPASWPASLSRRHSFVGASLPDVGPGGGESVALGDASYSDDAEDVLRSTMMTDSSRSFEHRESKLVLSPSSSLRIFLDFISVLILLYDIVTIPWILAWEVALLGWLRIMALGMAVFWTLDIFVNFRTGFYVHGEVRLKTREIAQRYAKTWLAPDVAMVLLDWTSLLLTLVEEDGEEQEGGSNIGVRMMGVLRFTKWSRVLRLLSLARLARFSDLFERIMDRSYFSPRVLIGFQVVRLIFFVAYVNHVGACVWWAVGRFGHSNTGSRWVDLQVVGLDVSYREAGAFFQYVACLHWAMTQILAGSMQIIATNEFEHLFTVFCLIFGVLFLSSLVSTLAAKVMQLRMLHQEKYRKLEQLRSFLQRKSIGAELAVNVIKQVEGSLQEKKPAALMQLQAWDIMSERNRSWLHLELCRPHVLRHPLLALFSNVDEKLVKSICEKAVTMSVHSQHATIFTAGTESSQAYLVISGSLKYTQDPETSMVKCDLERSVSKGDWICEAGLWSQWTHVGTLEVVNVCEVLEINGPNLAEALQRNSYVSQISGEYSKLFHARLQNAKPPYADWPTDLDVPYTTYAELVSTMSERVRSYVGLVALQNTHKPFTPFHYGLRHEVKEGKTTVLTNSNGDLETVFSAVQLQLENNEGRVLVQLGIWNELNSALVPTCSLPNTRQRKGELPCTALKRLLRTQLQPFGAMELQYCTSSVECKVERGVNVRTTTIKHVANLTHTDLSYLPSANSRREPDSPPPPVWHVSSIFSDAIGVSNNTECGQLSTSTSMGSSWEEVLVVAGEAEGRGWKDETEVKLLAWMDPLTFEHLSSPQNRAHLSRMLAMIHVDDVSLKKALEIYADGRWSEEGSMSAGCDQARRLTLLEQELRMRIKQDVV